MIYEGSLEERLARAATEVSLLEEGLELDNLRIKVRSIKDRFRVRQAMDKAESMQVAEELMEFCYRANELGEDERE